MAIEVKSVATKRTVVQCECGRKVSSRHLRRHLKTHGLERETLEASVAAAYGRMQKSERVLREWPDCRKLVRFFNQIFDLFRSEYNALK